MQEEKKLAKTMAGNIEEFRQVNYQQDNTNKIKIIVKYK